MDEAAGGGTQCGRGGVGLLGRLLTNGCFFTEVDMGCPGLWVLVAAMGLWVTAPCAERARDTPNADLNADLDVVLVAAWRLGVSDGALEVPSSDAKGEAERLRESEDASGGKHDSQRKEYAKQDSEGKVEMHRQSSSP